MLLGELAGYVAQTLPGITVQAGQETPNQDFNLQPSAWISGTITGPSGSPIFRALVTANSTNGQFSGFEYTNETGFYRITTGLNSSTYTVTAKYQGISASKTSVVANAPNETKNVNVQITGALPTGAEVIGRVTNTAGTGIGSAVVQVGSVQTKTDPKGYYSYLLASGSSGSLVVSTSVPGFATNKTTVTITNPITRVYYPVTASSGFIVNPLSGASSGKITGNVSGQSNPVPEFPVLTVPAIFSIAILFILLATRRLKSNKSKA